MSSVEDKLNLMYCRVVDTIGTNHEREEIIPALLDAAGYLGKIHIILEIGSYRGGNLPIYSVVLEENGTLISMDPMIQILLEVDVVNSLIAPLRLIHVNGYSTEASTLEEVRNILHSRKINFLMIGGNHMEEVVRNYWETYSPLLASPSVVMFHDIDDQYQLGPGVVFRELAEIYEHRQYSIHGKRLGIGSIFL